MANHPYIRFGNAQKTGNIRTGLLMIESHHDDQALAFFQALHAAGKLRMIELREAGLYRKQIRPKLFQQTCSSLGAAA